MDTTMPLQTPMFQTPLVVTPQPHRLTHPTRLPRLLLVLALVLAVHGAPQGAAQTALPDGAEIMRQVNARDEGQWVSRHLRMEMTDRGGTTRQRETIGFRRYYGDEKRTVIFYLAPTNIKGTGFLTYDYPNPKQDDDQWLYLPALRKVRRISAAERGDYFLGTDFTYEDIKKESKVSLEDYTFTTLGEDAVDGVRTYVVQGTPVNATVAKELGYGRVVWRVDPRTWISRKTEMWDINGNPLKTVYAQDIQQLQGIWTAMRLSVEHHKTGHRTQCLFSNVDYRTEVADDVFEQSTLRRGF